MNALSKVAAVTPRPETRLTGIEGLRGLAALSVLIYHSGALMTPQSSEDGSLGHIGALGQGVTLFFVLSGFLLFRPFAASLIHGRPAPATSRFFTNRFLRIWPAYVVILLAVNYIFQVSRMPGYFMPETTTLVGSLAWYEVLVNALLLQNLDPSLIRTGLEVAWTLTVEISFYVVLPLLARMARSAPRRIPVVIALMIPVGLLFILGILGKAWLMLATRSLSGEASHYIQWGDTWSAVASRSILVQADLFAYGMAAAVLHVLWTTGMVRDSFQRAIRLYLGPVAALLLILVALQLLSRLADIAAAIGFAAIVLLAVLPTDQGTTSWLGRTLEWRPLTYAGLISYSVYLWHLPVIRWLAAHGVSFDDSVSGFATGTALVVVVTGVLSSVTYFAIEKPSLKLKSRRVRPGSRRESRRVAGSTAP